MADCGRCGQSGPGSGQSDGICADCRLGKSAAAGSTDSTRRATNAVADQRKGRGRRNGDKQ